MIFFVEMIRFIFEPKVGQQDKADMKGRLIFTYLKWFRKKRRMRVVVCRAPDKNKFPYRNKENELVILIKSAQNKKGRSFHIRFDLPFN